jgi:hypothetical protein
MTVSAPNRARDLLRAAAVWLFLAVPAATAAATEYEQLLVFVQPGRSTVAEVFAAEQLPVIRQTAENMGVHTHVVSIQNGAPPAVALTPLLVYQNHRGRSIYQGRTTTPDRIRNFIRTSRYIPQGKTPNRRLQIPVWRLGRTRIWAPLKVSAVTGTPPPGYDDATFRQDAWDAIVEGFRHFELQPQADLGRADRGFYMDFYPWRAEDGTLFLSLALYSQFHCKAPIFEKKKMPLTGPWEQRRQLFREAAALLEAQVAAHIERGEHGDGFDTVADDVAAKDWAALGYPLPPHPPSQTAGEPTEAQLAADWILAAADPDAPPMIQFRFAPPLDNYAGEVTSGRGALRLAPSLVLEGAAGQIEVDTRSAITMGDPVLDEAIQGSLLLGARTHPRSRFTIESLSSDGRPIAFGQLSPAQIAGTFELKGRPMPLTAPAEIEPVIGADGRPRLLVRTAFEIDLRQFDIEGADGPAPARHTLRFDVHLQFAPQPGN